MIEEITSSQFVHHYFEKIYTELDHSPETFLRAALEFIQKEAGLLSQPDALANLCRLAEDVAGNADENTPESPPETAPLPQVAKTAVGNRNNVTRTVSEEMVDAPALGNQEKEEEEGESAVNKGIAPNAGNGADLPTYSWTQTLQELFIAIPVQSGTKGKMCDVQISRTKLKAGLRGEAAPILEGDLFAAVKPDDSVWNLVDGKILEISLAKVDSMQWWRAVVAGEPEIDVSSVEPEASKLSDLDGEMRAQVEKMMFDQRQKAMGLPTSEEVSKQEAYKRFMEAHPDLDFSQAKFM